MKISKLFHWLYAFLMFLPITFILPTLFYFGFNDNAIAQEYTKEEPNYYESNEVNSYDDLIVGHIYRYTYNLDAPIDPLFYSFNYSEFVLDNGTVIGTGSSGTNLRSIQNFNYNNRNYTRVFSPTDSGVASYTDYMNCTAYVVYNGNSNNNNVYLSLSYTDYELIRDYTEVTYTMGITDSVNQAIIDTFDLPMFAWATNNILVAPFSSICSFFGIASTSVLIKYLYYWLTISVIWLVFDVLMYIPLLVHNYIDKARIE